MYRLTKTNYMEIKDSDNLKKLNQQILLQENFSYQEALKIFEALYKEAVHIGAITSANIWEGFEVDLRVAKAVNGLK